MFWRIAVDGRNSKAAPLDNAKEMENGLVGRGKEGLRWSLSIEKAVATSAALGKRFIRENEEGRRDKAGSCSLME